MPSFQSGHLKLSTYICLSSSLWFSLEFSDTAGIFFIYTCTMEDTKAQEETVLENGLCPETKDILLARTFFAANWVRPKPVMVLVEQD